MKPLYRLYGIEPDYIDMAGRRQSPPKPVLLQALRLLGAPVSSEKDFASALRQKRQELKQRRLPIAAVLWEGKGGIRLNLFARDWPKGRLRAELRLEEGRRIQIQKPLSQLVGGRLPLPQLPAGIHRLQMEAGGKIWDCRVISAPQLCYWPALPKKREWGFFLPLHAFHRQGTPHGSYPDLARMAKWTALQGGSLVGTLPLMPLFLDKPHDPSPYSPVSQRLWGEFWVDVGLRDNPSKKESLVDYRRWMGSKWKKLSSEAKSCRVPSGFFKEFPHVESYARFRSRLDVTGKSWRHWPEPMRSGWLGPGVYDESRAKTYRYAQWRAHTQLSLAAEESRREGVILYLDLPLGSHPDGYDVWSEQEQFVLGANAGAPPDTFFTKGQDWGFPPLHPERIRADGYRYWSEALKHSMQAAGLLRIDHVMRLYRLFWIPQGAAAKDGVYIRYPAEELYAVLSLESHRNFCAVAGEDLGIVPAQVRRDMRRHRVCGLFVVQYEIRPNPRRPFRKIPAESVASLNTHDMQPFAAFWKTTSTKIRAALGQSVPGTGRVPGTDFRGFTAALRMLLKSPARWVLINLEDLWGETEQQNRPGTGPEKPNWRRKARYGFEQWTSLF